MEQVSLNVFKFRIKDLKADSLGFSVLSCLVVQLTTESFFFLFTHSSLLMQILVLVYHILSPAVPLSATLYFCC